MTERMKKFLELASSDQGLRSRLEALKTGAAQDANRQMTALAAEKGIRLTEADFAPESRELDEDELDAVSGGVCCFCVLGGGGTGSESDAFTSLTCACVACGDGEGYKPNQQNPQAIKKVKRCQCVVGGQGDDSSL